MEITEIQSRRNSGIGSKELLLESHNNVAETLSLSPSSSLSQYTSLKDIMENLPTSKSSFCFYEGNNNYYEFDCSNITIKNELVKRAASVYLQSAALLVTKSDDVCFPAFWDKAKTKAASLCSWWRISAVKPVRDCVSSFLRFLSNILANVRLNIQPASSSSFRSSQFSNSFSSQK